MNSPFWSKQIASPEFINSWIKKFSENDFMFIAGPKITESDKQVVETASAYS